MRNVKNEGRKNESYVKGVWSGLFENMKYIMKFGKKVKNIKEIDNKLLNK